MKLKKCSDWSRRKQEQQLLLSFCGFQFALFFYSNQVFWEQQTVSLSAIEKCCHVFNRVTKQQHSDLTCSGKSFLNSRLPSEQLTLWAQNQDAVPKFQEIYSGKILTKAVYIHHELLYHWAATVAQGAKQNISELHCSNWAQTLRHPLQLKTEYSKTFQRTREMNWNS